LIAFAPLIMLAMIKFNQLGNIPKWFNALAVINIALIVGLRLGMVFGAPIVTRIGQIRSYYGFKEWAQLVKQKVGDSYVIMDNGFQNPAKYNYYTNSLKAFSYDSRYYRHTQFDIWPMEEQMQHQRAYHLIDTANAATTEIVDTKAGKWYGTWINDVRTYQKIKIDADFSNLKLHAGEERAIDLAITNPYPYIVNFSNKGVQSKVLLGVVFFKSDGFIFAQKSGDDFNNIVLKPGQSTHYTFHVKAPLMKGKYDMMFSVRTEPFEGSKNSKIVSLVVD
jgi:hypothetical protein